MNKIPKQLSQEQLNYIENRYEYKDGLIYNKKRKKIVNGKFVGKNKDHLAIEFNNKILKRNLYKHHVVWFLYYNEWPKKQLDHIDNNPKNNNVENLREATDQQQRRNQPKSKKRSYSSKYKGVFRDKSSNKWLSQIKVDRKCIHLGRFVIEIEAAKAYNEAASKYFGEFACLNVF